MDKTILEQSIANLPESEAQVLEELRKLPPEEVFILVQTTSRANLEKIAENGAIREEIVTLCQNNRELAEEVIKAVYLSHNVGIIKKPLSKEESVGIGTTLEKLHTKAITKEQATLDLIGYGMDAKDVNEYMAKR